MLMENKTQEACRQENTTLVTKILNLLVTTNMHTRSYKYTFSKAPLDLCKGNILSLVCNQVSRPSMQTNDWCLPRQAKTCGKFCKLAMVGKNRFHSNVPIVHWYLECSVDFIKAVLKLTFKIWSYSSGLFQTVDKTIARLRHSVYQFYDLTIFTDENILVRCQSSVRYLTK